MTILFMALVSASWAFWITAIILTWLFFHKTPNLPNPKFPPVSVLKPVKGIDCGAYQNFASFCKQDYPEYEILFGVDDPNDPVIDVIYRLIEDFPKIPIRLFINPSRTHNRKVGLLARLAAEARHSFLVASDSDMRVDPAYLRYVVPPLNDPEIGLVTCPYRGAEPETLTARLEALYIGVTFLPSIMVARQLLKMRFAMGATVALRRDALERIGGFESFANHLADDYELGFRIAKSGLKVVLSPYIVNTILGATTFPDQWEREVRWSHCNRLSRPFQYPGLLITFTSPLALVLLIVSNFQTWAFGMLAVSLLLRWLVGLLVTQWTKDGAARRWLIWLPIRDFLTSLVWCAGIVGRRIVWRGEAYALQPGGSLIPYSEYEKQSLWKPENLLRRPVLFLDVLLRKVYRVFEFTHSQECLLRLSTHSNRDDLQLSDGTHINVGDTVAILHFWNEHMPQIPKTGADLAWAQKFHKQTINSLEELAAFIHDSPEMQSVTGFHGVPPFGGDGFSAVSQKIFERWGFELVPNEKPDNLQNRFTRFWENFYMMALVWAFNPKSLKGKQPFQLRRDELWISRKALMEKYWNNHGGNGAHHKIEETQRQAVDPIGGDLPRV